MGKHGNIKFIQLDRIIFDGKHRKLSYGAKWLYCVLTELEHCYEGDRKDSFFQSNKHLSERAGMSERSIVTFKDELKKAGIIQHGNIHWIDQKTKKKSKKKVSAYRINRSKK